MLPQTTINKTGAKTVIVHNILNGFARVTKKIYISQQAIYFLMENGLQLATQYQSFPPVTK
jgi:hypothetical protein